MNTLNNLEFLITDWSDKKGILKYGTIAGQMGKLQEEFDELKDGLYNKDPAEVSDAIGDMIVVLNNIAVMYDTTLTACLNGAYNEIKDRKGEMRSDGKFHKE